MTKHQKTLKARVSDLLALFCALIISACDTSAVVEPTHPEPPASWEAHVERIDVPVEAIPALTSPKALVRALEDGVFKKMRNRTAAATPKQIQALVQVRAFAEEIVAAGGAVTPDVLDAMIREADAALEPFINKEDAAYISAVFQRLDALGTSSEDYSSLTKSLEVEGLLAKTGPCDQACVASYANNVAMIEFAYLGGLAACTFSGPISPICFGVATAVKTASIVSSTLDYTTCVKTCRETT